MAGRYLLIEFDEEQSASSLRAQIDAATKKGRKYRVVGMYSRPGPDFCRCGTWTTDRGKVATTKTGRKFGWVVCTVCKKPAPIISFLRNIIKPEEIIDPYTHESLDGRHTLMFNFMGIGAPTRAVPRKTE